MPNNVKTVPLTANNGGWNPVPKIQLPANSGEWVISFQIKGANDIKFDATDPIWVREGKKPVATIKDHPLISAKHVTQDGKELIVLSRNNNPEDDGAVDIHYQLNFQGSSPIDPIIENGGGPRQLHDGFTATFLAIAAGIAFLAGIFAYWGYRKLTG